MGFMRRFDPGYAAARLRLSEGAIGKVVLFKSTSRDPYRTSLEYADVRSSGGMILDMGIHDFDLARFFMGEVKTVTAIGGAIFPLLIDLQIGKDADGNESRWVRAGARGRG